MLTVAGTVLPAPDCPAGGAEVGQAAAGLIGELACRSAGNFFTAEQLGPPYRLSPEPDGEPAAGLADRTGRYELTTVELGTTIKPCIRSAERVV